MSDEDGQSKVVALVDGGSESVFDASIGGHSHSVGSESGKVEMSWSNRLLTLRGAAGAVMSVLGDPRVVLERVSLMETGERILVLLVTLHQPDSL